MTNSNPPLQEPTTYNFELLHQNIASILSKQEQLEITLQGLQAQNINPDVLCFTETFLDANRCQYVKIKGYVLGTSYNRKKYMKNSGGSCIMLKKGLSYTEITYLKHLAADNVFECCGVEIKSSKLIIICIYRTPSSDPNVFLDKFDLLLHELTRKTKNDMKIILTGDFNVDTLKNGNITDRFQNIALNYQFILHISEPTRKNSCIDHILSNIKNAKGSVLPLGLSDHETAQLLKFPISYKKITCSSYFVYKRDYNEDYINKFKNCLSNLSWSEVYSETDLNAAFDKFYDLFRLFYNLCFPKIKIKISDGGNVQKWISKGLKISFNTKRSLRFSYYRNKLTSDKHKYKIYSHILKKCVGKSKKNLNMKYILKSKNKCKASWTVINKEIFNKNITKHDIEYIKVDNKLLKNPVDMATAFNRHYINIPENSSKVQKSVRVGMQPANSMFLEPFSAAEVRKEVMSLNNTKSEGYDEISTHIVKCCVDEILPVLTYLISLSFETGTFPNALKFTVVKPLFKKGSKDDILNYRPIALLPIFSKIFEKCMLKRLLKFCNKYNIIKEQQFGFQKGKSTTLAIFTLIHTVLSSLNNNKLTTALFFDMSKAFDHVCHDLLLRKLEKLGIRGLAHKWMSTYLQDRQQCVAISKLNECNEMTTYYSNYSCIKYGVPQGSVLGPILFILYINDIIDITNHKCILFADDISIIVTSDKKNNSINDHELDINKTVKTIIEWLDINNLTINLSKSNYIHFNNTYRSRPKVDLNIKYNNTIINNISETKFLGVTIDRTLNWIPHIKNVCKKVNKFVYALRQIKRITDIKTAVTAYHAYVESVLRYALIIWGNGDSASLKRLFSSQKKCLRAICGIPPYESCRPLFAKLGLLPLPCLYILEIGLFVKKHGLLFKKASDINARSRRDGNKLILCEVPKSAKYNKNCLTMCVRIFNKIPNEFKSLNLTLFRRKLYDWLKKQNFYTIKDFFCYASRTCLI